MGVKRIGVTDYSKKMLKALDNKLNLAISECYKHPSYFTYFRKNRRWFRDLKGKIIDNPPKYYVKRIEVNEDKNGNIINVSYTYYSCNDLIESPSFVVKTKLY